LVRSSYSYDAGFAEILSNSYYFSVKSAAVETVWTLLAVVTKMRVVCTDDVGPGAVALGSLQLRGGSWPAV